MTWPMRRHGLLHGPDSDREVVVVQRRDAPVGCESPSYHVRQQRIAPIHGRELGRRLRAAQHAAGLDGVQLAKRLDRSEPWISRMTSGMFFPSVADVASMLAVCGVVGDERDRILDLAHPRHDGDVVRISDGSQWDALLYHASEAVEWVEYSPLMIPWLAQSTDYVHAYWAQCQFHDRQGLWGGKVRPGAAVRLRADLGRIELVVHEVALRVLVAARGARSAQMTALLTLSGMNKALVRVIPVACAIPAAAQSGFTVLRYANRPDIVYREEPASGVFIDDPDQVAAHLEVIGQLRRAALSRPESSALLEQIRDEPASELEPLDPG